jgi:CubicO group peptidase (beta-lactamase class C family)
MIPSQIQKVIVKLMRKFRVPGLAISILKKGRVDEQGFGARNLENNLPMTPHTLIGIGSVTKSFTSLLMLKLKERNLLNLDDPVKKYLEQEPFISHPDITLTHLLSHSSGIPSVDGQWFPHAISFGDYSRVYPVCSKQDFLYHISETKPEIIFEPDAKFFYNNDMYTILGYIIEKVTGNTYAEVLRRELLDPLKMLRSTVKRERLEKDPLEDHITGYAHKAISEKVSLKAEKLPFSGNLEAPGGIYTSMHEMINYGKFLLQEGNFDKKQVISPESIKELWTPRVDSPYGFGSSPKYCLGWVREEDFLGHTLIHHGGSLNVSSSFFGLIPEQKLAVSVAENDGLGICSIVGTSALALLIGRDPEQVDNKLRLIQLSEDLVGTYKSSLDLYRLEVYFENQSIHIRVETDDGEFKFPLILIDFDKLEFQIFSTIPNPLFKVQFYRDPETQKIAHVSYDRYLYHKK